MQELDRPPPAHGFRTVPSSPDLRGRPAVPSRGPLRRAAEILNSGDRTAVLAGRGAAGGRAEAERLARTLGAGVAGALPGRDVLSDGLPRATGVIVPSFP